MPKPSSALLSLLLLPFVPGCTTRTAQAPGHPETPAPAPVPVAAPAEPTSAYLFVHFTGESAAGEQIYFSVSEDGMNWRDLNNSEPVLVSNLGEMGVRDPSIVRSPDGKKFTILATDLRIAAGKGWGAATTHGSTSLVFWESSDLLTWSQPWMVDVASAIPGAACAWAPEAIHDADTGDYLVYWATISPRDGVREARIYASWTHDFHTFSAPELYIERAGEGDIIDTQIIEVAGAKHRYYRASRDTQITLEGADSLLGTWERVGDLSSLGYTGRQVEGPILFQFNQQPKWGLLVDQYAAGRGYLPLVSANLDAPQGFQVARNGDYSLGASRKRHGGILNITRREYEALLAKWPGTPSHRLASAASPGRFVRHADFRLRLDSDVRPAEDAHWRIVPGLTGEEGTVSLHAINFPSHYLTMTASGLALVPLENGADFASRATFRQVPGLTDSAGVSFRLPGGQPGGAGTYLMDLGSELGAGAAITGAERERATFYLRD